MEAYHDILRRLADTIESGGQDWKAVVKELIYLVNTIVRTNMVDKKESGRQPSP